MHRNLLRNSLLLASLVPATAAFAGDGDLDPAFGSDNGRLTIDFALDPLSEDVATDVVVYPDRSIAAVGAVNVAGRTAMAVVRRDPDGHAHADWQLALLQAEGVDVFPMAIARQTDDALVVAGAYQAGGLQKWIACRINASGEPDASFGDDLITGCTTHFAEDTELEGEINDLVVQPGGRIIFAGRALDAGQQSRATLSALRADGAPDLTFADDGGEKNIVVPFANVGPTSTFSSIALGKNGFFAAAGTYTISNSDSDFIVTSFKSDGSPVPGFGANGRVIDAINIGPAGHRRDTAQGIAVVNGRVIVAGSAARTFDGKTSGVVVQYTPSGTPDNQFGTAGRTFVAGEGSGNILLSDLAVSSKGRLLLTGSSAEGDSKRALAFRLSAEGALDLGFSANTGFFSFTSSESVLSHSVGEAIAVQGDRAIVAGTLRLQDPINANFGLARVGDGAIFSDSYEIEN